MQILLLQDVENLGEEGEIVSVKDGYGRNYLIPQKLALMATPGTVKARQEELRQASRKRAKLKESAEQQAAELAKTEVVITAKVGEENRIFGTVTPTQVADALQQQGYEVDRRQVEMDEDVRMLGVYTASVKLHKEVHAKVKVRVEPEETAEAES